MKSIGGVIGGLLWVAGVVIAKGFWSTFFAVIIPFWSWYLLVEKILKVYKLVP